MGHIAARVPRPLCASDPHEGASLVACYSQHRHRPVPSTSPHTSEWICHMCEPSRGRAQSAHSASSAFLLFQDALLSSAAFFLRQLAFCCKWWEEDLNPHLIAGARFSSAFRYLSRGAQVRCVLSSTTPPKRATGSRTPRTVISFLGENHHSIQFARDARAALVWGQVRRAPSSVLGNRRA